jgi:hypothetical protein
MSPQTALSRRESRECVVGQLPPSEYHSAEKTAQSWFQTPGFAVLYAAATHALIADCDSGHSVTAFYRVERYLGMFRKVQFIASMPLTYESLKETISRNRAHLISIPLINTDSPAFNNSEVLSRYTWRMTRHSEDIVINLPATKEEYLASLGKQTRKHLPYYVRRLEREWGTQLRFVYRAGGDIRLDDFRRLVELNGMRMQRKWKRSGWTEEMVLNRWRLACNIGVLTGVYREDQLVAGTISYLHRGEAFLALIAHDPVYDVLNLGSVALHKTIDQAIAKGCFAFHLLWGCGFYKRQFGGEERPLFEVVVFRRGYLAHLWNSVRAVRQSMRYIKQVLTPVARKSGRLLISAFER